MEVNPRELSSHYKDIRKRLTAGNVVPMPIRETTPAQHNGPAEVLFHPAIAEATDPLGVCDFPTPSMKMIVEEVAEFYGVPPSAIVGESHRAAFVRARWIATWLADHLTGFSSVRIGRSFGNRDHSTIINGIRKIEAARETNERLADEIQVIKLRILDRLGANNG
jgi:hypothetical protein